MKHSLVLFLSVVLLPLFFPEVGKAQTAIMEDLREDFNQYSSHALQEKIFVHTDQSFYLAGETMWFKVYLLEGSTHKPLDLSKVAYIEVLNRDDTPVLQAKIAMKEGRGHGSFYLPLGVKSGNYKLRAYTSWMKNFSPDFYFEKDLSIVNTFVSPEAGQQEKLSALDLQFFPEGGGLVRGIRSKVAFKAVNHQGKGENVKGVVVKDSGDTVAVLEALKFGMGHFYLTPEANSSYKAIVSAGIDHPQSFTLPAVHEQGYVMHVNELNADQLEVSVQSTFSDQAVILFAQTRQQVKAVESKRMNGGRAAFKLDKKAFGEGVSHITLFNAEKQPVAERLYFRFPKQMLAIHAETDKEQYGSREQVNVKIGTADSKGKPSGANLSVAVYQLDSLSQQAEDDILSYLWLSSDLRGKIESPSFYFENEGPEVEAAMDNLMLSQGWRRFKWEDVLQEKKPVLKHLPEYEGHFIQAVVTDMESGAPVEGIPSFMSVPGKLVQFYASKSNEEGVLRFITEQLYGTNQLIFQNPFTESKSTITVSNPFSENFSGFSPVPFSMSEAYSDEIRLRHIHMQAENTYWREERNRLIAPDLDSVAFFGAPDKAYLLDDFTRFPTMEEVMREYVYEVRVRKQNGKFVFKLLNPVLQTLFSDPPLVLLDGVPVFDINKIMEYNPLKVEKLEIVYEGYILGRGMVYDGILSYTTYKGNLEGYAIDSELMNLKYEGLQLEREFYTPTYGPEAENTSRKPDFRHLLHWAPDVNSSDDGQQQLSFYTSDLKGKFIIVVQGVTPQGDAGVTTTLMEVAEETL